MKKVEKRTKIKYNENRYRKNININEERVIKMKKTKIIVTTFLVSIIILLFVPQINYAVEKKITTDNFKLDQLNGYTNAYKKANNIVNTIQVVGVVVAVVGLIALGVKYMFGSVEERADYKKTMIPYLIGCIFIFSISTIIKLIYTITTEIAK